MQAAHSPKAPPKQNGKWWVPSEQLHTPTLPFVIAGSTAGTAAG
jgi:hypothetical protein